MTTRETLWIYFLVLILVTTTVLNDFFAAFSVIGLIVVAIHLFPKNKSSAILHSLFAFSLSLYLISIANISDVIFTVNHIAYGYFSVVGFQMLSKRKELFLPRNLTHGLIFLSIFFILLQATGVLPAPHFPRVSGIYPNPNQFAVFCLCLLFANFYRNRSFIMGLSAQSSMFAPLILWRRFLPLRKVTFLFALFVITSLFLALAYWSSLPNLKYMYFVDALLNASSLNMDDIKDAEEYSAYKRVFYLIAARNDFIDLASYASLGAFQFREGFLLSIVSINPIFGILLLVFSLVIGFRFILNRDYIYLVALVGWLFILPFFDPLLILLFNNGLFKSKNI